MNRICTFALMIIAFICCLSIKCNAQNPDSFYVIVMERNGLIYLDDDIFILPISKEINFDFKKYKKGSQLLYRDNRKDIKFYDIIDHNIFINGGYRLSVNTLANIKCCEAINIYSQPDSIKTSILNSYEFSFIEFNRIFYKKTNPTIILNNYHSKKHGIVNIHSFKVHANICLCNEFNDPNGDYTQKAYIPRDMKVSALTQQDSTCLANFFNSIIKNY